LGIQGVVWWSGCRWGWSTPPQSRNNANCVATHTHKKDISPAPFCFLLLAVAFALLMLFPCSHFCFVSFIWSCFPFFFTFWPPMSDAYQQRTWPRIRSICLFSLLRPKCIYSGMSSDGREKLRLPVHNRFAKKPISNRFTEKILL